MKLGFLELPPDERRLYIEQAAEPASFDDILTTLTELEKRIDHADGG